MPNRLTVDEFITKARAVHGLKYDYSQVVYENNRTPISIICHTHGPFLQKANSHLDLKTGCPACGRIKCDSGRSLSQQEFVARANIAHNDRYDYTKTIYTHNNHLVTITCPTHGDFIQRAYDHIKGNGRSTGCPRCGNLGISNKAIRWLNTIAQADKIYIQHALNGGEYKIPGTRFKADGFCAETNTVYEFYGDRWHGNLSVFTETDKCHPFSDKSAKQLHDDTIVRECLIRDCGYIVITTWEADFDATLNTTN